MLITHSLLFKISMTNFHEFADLLNVLGLAGMELIFHSSLCGAVFWICD